MVDSDVKREKHRAAVNAFLEKQLGLAGNGHVVSMEQREGVALIIEFENGHKLMFDSYGADESACAEIMVAGSDTYKDRRIDYKCGINLKLPYE